MQDRDGDGYGDLDVPAGVTPGTDCDDESPSAVDTFPGAAAIDGPFNCMKDSDDDDYGDINVSLPVVPGTDCDDDDPGVHPDTLELCDGVDSSCAGDVPVDERDLDNDFYVACDNWVGTTPGILGGGDCNDGDASTFPGAAPNETFPNACMKDQDGDDYGDLDPEVAGVTPGTDCDDDALTGVNTFPGAAPLDNAFTCMKDDDGDDYGDAMAQLPVVSGSDCDDDDASINPGAAEICDDMVDSDCDGEDPVCPAVTILVSLADATTVSWSLPLESVGLSTVYRGDLDVLRSTGVYTQEPGSSLEAARFCDVAGTNLSDSFVPGTGRAIFYLVTTQTPVGESSLGFDSLWQPRPNAHPCP